MTDTPSEAAKRKACELANARMEPHVTKYKVTEVEAYEPLYALALHLDEVDRVARWAVKAGFDIAEMRSLMLPDPVDPDEELAREVAEQFATIYPHAAEEVTRATIKRLREQGRLADAK